MGSHLGDGLTAKQRACYEMRRRGASWPEIAGAMAMSPQSARAAVDAAVRNGAEQLPKRGNRGAVPGLPADPNAAAKLANKLGGEIDVAKFGEMAAAAGVPPRLVSSLVRRLQLNLGNVRQELKRLSLAEQVQATNDKAQLVLSHIDELSIAGMNAKDLAMAYGILVDKAQLLGGKPTQIFDFNSRKRLEELMPQFIAEAKRRGITIDGTATVVQEKVIQEEDSHGEH